MINQTVMDIEVVKSVLKHRDPFLFIDSVSNISDDQIETSYKISDKNIFFKGHFPGEPVMPGVLLIEAIAQSSGFLIVYKLLKERGLKSNQIKYDSYLVKVNSFKFKDKIVPNAIIHIKVKLSQISENFFEVVGQIYVDKKIKAIGNLMLYFRIVD